MHTIRPNKVPCTVVTDSSASAGLSKTYFKKALCTKNLKYAFMALKRVGLGLKPCHYAQIIFMLLFFHTERATFLQEAYLKSLVRDLIIFFLSRIQISPHLLKLFFGFFKGKLGIELK